MLPTLSGIEVCRQIRTDPASPASIVTIRGLGYKFEPPASNTESAVRSSGPGG